MRADLKQDTKDALLAILMFVVLALVAGQTKPKPIEPPALEVRCSVEHLDPRQPLPTQHVNGGHSQYLVTTLPCENNVKLTLIWHD